MVFPGHFSRGCLRCRQRKVKCDETRPSCRRCFIYGKPCTGYTDQFQFRHRRTSSSVTAAGSEPAPQECKEGQWSQSPRRRSSQQLEVTEKAEEQQLVLVQHQQQKEQQAVQNVAWSHAVARAPEPCYDHVSLFYFIHRFVSPNPEDGFPGHLSFLPSLYDSHGHGLLEVATLSVAQMAAYNKFGGEKFRVQSYKNYGRAIRMLQSIIGSEDQATDDKVITSILLLCVLKDISGERHGGPGEHAPGLFYLVEKRGPEQIATSRGSELLFLSLIRLQVYSFLHDDDTYVDPGAIATVWGAFDPLLRALGMMSRTLTLRHRLMSGHTYLDAEEQACIIQRCSETLDEFHHWDVEAATYWQSMFKGRGTPTALGEVASGTTHYDVETACTIILVRSARLILLMSKIAHHYLQGQQDAMGAMLAEYIPFLELDVAAVIDDILASVPYALGDVGPGGLPGSLAHDGAAAIVIVHSIRLVSSCAYLTPEQSRKAMDVLARLNAGIGIRAAVGMEEEDINRSRWAQEQVALRSRILSRTLGSSPSSSSADDPVSPMVATSPQCTVVGQGQARIQAVDFGCMISS
ncbi:Sterol uptake control 2 [Madurella fahalii]|uniref:Sterol uptake control 2 n=1 Tax=Madurella fahalii TaxID=1157608 RepID=A0ABQ0G6B3_9PEZI